MAELILEYSTPLRTPDGERFVARAYGEERSDRTWIGWIEFLSITGNGLILRTDRETTQPNRTTLEYWASGIEPIYLEGAFERAQVQSTNARQ